MVPPSIAARLSSLKQYEGVGPANHRGHFITAPALRSAVMASGSGQLHDSACGSRGNSSHSRGLQWKIATELAAPHNNQLHDIHIHSNIQGVNDDAYCGRYLSLYSSPGHCLPAAEGISQLKWYWFNEPQPLIDLDRFDTASRGPWGSLLLLFHTRKQ